MTTGPTATLTRRCVWCLGLTALLLWSLGVLVALGRPSLSASALGRTVIAAFDLDAEQTITAWFSSSILLAAAALWALGGLRAKPGTGDGPGPWFACAGITALLSMDESVGLHERLGNAIHRRLPDLGLETFAWILPGAVFALGAGALLSGFLHRQPPTFRRRVWVAAACFFGGALGVEAVGAWIHARAGRDSLLFALQVWVEEGLELTGAVLGLRALAQHLLVEAPSSAPSAGDVGHRPAERGGGQ